MQNATTAAQSPASRDSRIGRAVSKALEQSRAGNLPTLLRTYEDQWATTQVWSVASRTTAGQVYLIDLTADADGLHTHCTCQGGDESVICWHRASCRLAALHEISHHDGRQPIQRLTSNDLMGGSH